MIAGMALRAQERRIMLVTVGLAIAAFALGGDRLGASLHVFSPEQYVRFLSLNAWSVAGLTAFVALQYSSAWTKLADRGRD
jgi:hypothetical protein